MSLPPVQILRVEVLILKGTGNCVFSAWNFAMKWICSMSSTENTQEQQKIKKKERREREKERKKEKAKVCARWGVQPIIHLQIQLSVRLNVSRLLCFRSAGDERICLKRITLAPGGEIQLYVGKQPGTWCTWSPRHSEQKQPSGACLRIRHQPVGLTSKEPEWKSDPDKSLSVKHTYLSTEMLKKPLEWVWGLRKCCQWPWEG